MTKEEREKAIDLLDNLLGMVEDNQDNDYDKALKMGIESLRKEPCEDWHDIYSDEMTLEQSRQAVMDLREKLAECLRKEPCEDAVSRKAVLNTLNRMDSVLDEDRTVEMYKELLIACYNDLPPVTPARPKGHWINIDKTHSKCDRCGAVFEIASENGEANYCPNCGAEMESEDEY